MGVVINGGSKESDSASNSSDPASSAVTEFRDYRTVGGLDLNLPAPDVGRDECGHSRKTLWLLK